MAYLPQSTVIVWFPNALLYLIDKTQRRERERDTEREREKQNKDEETEPDRE